MTAPFGGCRIPIRSRTRDILREKNARPTKLWMARSAEAVPGARPHRRRRILPWLARTPAALYRFGRSRHRASRERWPPRPSGTRPERAGGTSRRAPGLPGDCPPSPWPPSASRAHPPRCRCRRTCVSTSANSAAARGASPCRKTDQARFEGGARGLGGDRGSGSRGDQRAPRRTARRSGPDRRPDWLARRFRFSWPAPLGLTRFLLGRSATIDLPRTAHPLVARIQDDAAAACGPHFDATARDGDLGELAS